MNQTDSHIRQTYWNTRFRFTGEIIQRAIDRGEISPNIDPSIVMTAIIGALYVRMLVLETPLDEPFLNQLTQMILEGLLQNSKQ